jgi:V/A-type H+-transporting ATPase subunit C
MFGKLIQKLQSRAMKYGYSNARVKGMKGLLLTKQFLDELINIKKIEAMAELLQRTTYKDDINYYAAKYRDSALIELAAIRHFGKIVKKIRKLAPEDEKPVIDALLKKWDLLNLKMIINAKRVGKTFEDVRPYLISTGIVDENEYERIIRADEAALFEEIKKTALGQEMLSLSTAVFNKQMLKTFNSALRSMDKFIQLQTIIDAYIYLFMDKALKSENKDVERIRDILKKEIDVKNILLIERLKAHGIEKNKIKSYLIKGGTLPESFVDQLVEAKELKEVLALLKTKFQKLTKESEEITSLVSLEIALEKAIAAEKTKAFYRSILSIGVLLGFLLLKEEELNNLRKIAKAKQFNVPEEEVRKMLVVV